MRLFRKATTRTFDDTIIESYGSEENVPDLIDFVESGYLYNALCLLAPFS